MKKWYDEEYEWEIEVIGFNKDNEETERFCRNGEEVGDKYTCTYGCPVNSQGQGRSEEHTSELQSREVTMTISYAVLCL